MGGEGRPVRALAREWAAAKIALARGRGLGRGRGRAGATTWSLAPSHSLCALKSPPPPGKKKILS